MWTHLIKFCLYLSFLGFVVNSDPINLSQPDSLSNSTLTIEDVSDEVIVQLEKLFDKKANETIKQISEMLDKENEIELSRSKRRTYLIHNLVGVQKLKTIKPHSDVCKHASIMELTKYAEMTVIVCPQSDSSLTVYYQSANSEQLDSISIPFELSSAPMQINSFIHNNTLYIVTSQYKLDGVTVFGVTQNDSALQVTQTLSSNISYPVAMDLLVTQFEGDSEEEVKVIAMLHTSNHTHYQVHFWNETDTQFELISEGSISNDSLIKDICSFTIEEVNYVVLIDNANETSYASAGETIIYKLTKDMHYQEIQRIESYGAVDCEYFSTKDEATGVNYFLGIANTFDAVNDSSADLAIYRFDNGKFKPFQCIKTEKAQKLVAYAYQTKGTKNLPGQYEFLLMLLEHSRIRLFQYSGWRFFELINVTDSLRGSFKSIFSPRNQDLQIVGITQNDKRRSTSSILELEFEDEENLHDWYRDSLSWCNATLNALEGIRAYKLEDKMKNVFYIDQKEEIRLYGDIIFDSLNVRSILRSPDVIDKNGHSYANSFRQGFETVISSLGQLEREIQDLNHTLASAMRLNGDQLISGAITFNSTYFNCGDKGCQIGSINVDRINGRDLKNISSEVIRLDQDQVFDQMFNFSSIVAEKDVEVVSINGIKPENIVTRSGDHHISGSVQFTSPVDVYHLHVPGTVNGRSVNRKTVLTVNDDQTIKSDVQFVNQITVHNLQVDGPVVRLGTTLSSFLPNVVTINASSPITGKKTFRSLSVDNMELVAGYINDINIKDLHKNMLRRSDNRNMVDSIEIGQLTIKGDAWVDKINGIQFNESFVRRNVPMTVYGDKIFSSRVTIDRMNITGFLNGKQVDPSLGLLLKHGNQTVTGSKTFKSINIPGEAKFFGNISSLDPAELRNKLKRAIGGGVNRTLSGPIRVKSIKVDGLVNGINLTDLLNNYLTVNQSDIPVANDLFIERAVFSQPLTCKTINGFRFPDDFLTINTNQRFDQPVVFVNNITVDSSLTLNRLNNFSVDSIIADSLSSTGYQKITTPKEIYGNLFVKNLKVARLNDISMSDLVLLHQDGIILGNKTFSSLKISGDSRVGQIREIKMLNGVEFNDFIDNSINRRGFQDIVPKIKVKKLIIPEETDISVTKIGDLDLNDVIKSAVKLRSNDVQIIRGKKTFSNSVAFGNLKFYKTFAGFTSEEFLQIYINQTDQDIYADINFNSDLTVEGNLVVHGTLNKIDLEKLQRHLPISDKPIVINRPMRFHQVKVTGGDVKSHGTINGIQFANSVIKKSSPVVNLHGDKVFAGGILIKDHLFVSSTINNISIDSICQPIDSMSSRPYSLTIIGDVTAQNSLMSGTVNDEKFDPRSTLTDRTSVKGVKKFKKLIVKGPINLDGRLNNHDLLYLKKNYLSRSKDQLIVDSDLIVRNVTFSGPVTINGNLNGKNVLINNIDLNTLATNTLHQTGDQSIRGTFNFPGKVIFKQGVYSSYNIELNKTIVNLVQDAFLKNRANQISGEVRFRNGIVVRNLTTNRQSTFGRHLRSLVSITASQVIYGSKNFTSLEVDDLWVNSINGIPIEKFLRSDIGATISSPVKFVQGFEVRSNLTVRGTINGFKLDSLKESLVLQGSNNNTIEAPMTLTTKPVIRYLEMPDSMNVDPRSYLTKALIPKKLDDLQRKISLSERKLRELAQFFETQGQCIDYFEETGQQIKGAKLLQFVSTSRDAKQFFVSQETYNCHQLSVGSIIYDQPVIDPKQSVTTYRPTAAMISHFNGIQFLIVLNNNPDLATFPVECIDRNFLDVRGSGRALLQVFRREAKLNSYLPHQYFYIDNPSDAQVFVRGKRDCMAVAIPHSNNPFSFRSPSVFCFIEGSLLEERLNGSLNAEKIAAVSFDDGSAIIATVHSISDDLPLKVTIYKSYLDSRFKEIETFDASRIVLPTTIHLNTVGDKVNLIIAQGIKPGYATVSNVRVFTSDVNSTGTFSQTQRLEGISRDVIQIASINSGVSYVNLFIMSEKENIHIYKSQIDSNFVLYKTVNPKDAARFAIVYGENKNFFTYLLLTKMSLDNDNGIKDKTIILKTRMDNNVRGQLDG